MLSNGVFAYRLTFQKVWSFIIHIVLNKKVSIISGKVIRQIGYLRMEEGLLEDADDLFQESLEISDTCTKIPTKATIHYYVGLLRFVLMVFLNCLMNSSL